MPQGTVTAFDASRGLGIVTSGGVEFPFQATAVADGSRTVAVGATVTFTPIHRSGGRLEAGAISPC
jgi:cold shock CspA family protein